MEADQELNWQSPLGWIEAEKIVRKLGPLPPMLVAGIKAYESAPAIKRTSDPIELAQFTKDALGFTVKVVPTLKTAVFFAADEFKDHELYRLEKLDYLSLMGLFSADELPAICACSYIYHLIKQAVPFEELTFIKSCLGGYMAIAQTVAQGFEEASVGRVMAYSALKIIGLACLSAVDPAGFVRMRKKLDKKEIPYDLAEEELRWGCNHHQIASAWARAAGFGPMSRMVWAPDNTPIFFSPIKTAIPDISQGLSLYRNILYCSSSLHCSRKLPDGFELERDPGGTIASELTAAASRIAQSDNTNWLLRKKTDLPEDVRIALDIKLSNEERASLQPKD